MKKEKFSVAICVYGKDNPEFFDAAMASIVNQTVMPEEVVLVVDGPIPESIEHVIDKYRKLLTDVVFQVIYLEKNQGHGEARRIAFEHCQYEWIAWMDADDICVTDRFEKQIKFKNDNPQLSVVGGLIQEFVTTPEDCVGKRVVPNLDCDIKEYMKKRCPMNQVTVMFKKEDIAQVGGYIDWYCEEDYYLWIRLALAGKKFGNIDENLVYVRVGEEMYARRGGWKYFKSEAGIQKLMRKEKIISRTRFLINLTERLILQVLMPNTVRGFIFKMFARE